VVIIGAGMIGACLARELATQGIRRVTVLEKRSGPGLEATAASWAWLNANNKSPLAYQRLNYQGLRLWQTDSLLSSLSDFTGTLFLRDETGLDDVVSPQPDFIQVEKLPRDAAILHALEPNLSPFAVSDQVASCPRLYPEEGYCDPVAACAGILRAAQDLGVTVNYDEAVETIRVTADGRQIMVGTRSDTYTADRVILAGGTEVQALSKSLGYEIPMLHRPGILVHTNPTETRVQKRIVVAPSCYMLQRRDGTVVVGGDFNGASQRDDEEDTSAERAQRMLDAAGEIMPVVSEDLGVGHVTLGNRPYPADGLPVIGWLPGKEDLVYVTVMHSGITLAPIAARLGVKQLMDRLSPDEIRVLQDYTASRNELHHTNAQGQYDMQYHGPNHGTTSK